MLSIFLLLIYFPVNGGWSDFVASSNCSKSCGGGEQTLMRICNNPSPSKCGKQCEGSISTTQQCNNQDCPIKNTKKAGKSITKYKCSPNQKASV